MAVFMSSSPKKFQRVLDPGTDPKVVIRFNPDRSEVENVIRTVSEKKDTHRTVPASP